MAYGDGDGNLFGRISDSLDVTAHEITHGVTVNTANLVYRRESGALNEATSDIMAECAEAYFNGATDWQIGEDSYTPHINGDAVRYMFDPARDGISADFYRDVFPSNCAAYADCDVHLTSGIANLAFYLLVNGGTHPRGKSTVLVPAIGIHAAQEIWYRALTAYMTSGTDFAEARDTTLHAATDLFGFCSSKMVAVDKAWSAVGVRGRLPFRPPCSGFNILRNPGFEVENGYAFVSPSQAWTFTCGENNGCIYFIPVWIPEAHAFAPPHSGANMVTMVDRYLTNPTLYQQVTIPSSVNRATFSFWLHVITEEPQNSPQDDILRVQLRDSSNNVLTTLATYSNSDANTDYVKKSFDVSAYRGQTVRVYFEGRDSQFQDSSHSTYFSIDDLELFVE